MTSGVSCCSNSPPPPNLFPHLIVFVEPPNPTRLPETRTHQPGRRCGFNCLPSHPSTQTTFVSTMIPIINSIFSRLFSRAHRQSHSEDIAHDLIVGLVIVGDLKGARVPLFEDHDSPPCSVNDFPPAPDLKANQPDLKLHQS